MYDTFNKAKTVGKREHVVVTTWKHTHIQTVVKQNKKGSEKQNKNHKAVFAIVPERSLRRSTYHVVDSVFEKHTIPKHHDDPHTYMYTYLPNHAIHHLYKVHTHPPFH